MRTTTYIYIHDGAEVTCAPANDQCPPILRIRDAESGATVLVHLYSDAAATIVDELSEHAQPKELV